MVVTTDLAVADGFSVGSSSSSSSSSGSYSSSTSGVELGAGIMNTFLNRLGTDKTYRASSLGNSYLPIRLGARLFLTDRFFLYPYFGYSVRSWVQNDSSHKETVYMFGVPVGYQVATIGPVDFGIISGVGLFQQNIAGYGGVVARNNGTSVNNFAFPSKEFNMRMYFASIGSSLVFYDSVVLNFEYFSFAIMDSKRRIDNAMVTLLWKF